MKIFWKGRWDDRTIVITRELVSGFALLTYCVIGYNSRKIRDERREMREER